MDKKKIPLNAYLIFACILLVILYSFSVFKKPEAEQRKALSTALVNPKYRDDISRISIFNGGKSLTLDKSSETVCVGKKIDLKATVLPANALQHGCSR